MFDMKELLSSDFGSGDQSAAKLRVALAAAVSGAYRPKPHSAKELVFRFADDIQAMRELKWSWAQIAELFQTCGLEVSVPTMRRYGIEAAASADAEKVAQRVEAYWAEAADDEARREFERERKRAWRAKIKFSDSDPAVAPVSVAKAKAPNPATAPASAPIQRPAAPAAAPLPASLSKAIQQSVEIPPELAPGTFHIDPADDDLTSRPFVWLLASIANAKNPGQKTFFIPDGRPGHTTLPVQVARPVAVLSGEVSSWQALFPGLGTAAE